MQRVNILLPVALCALCSEGIARESQPNIILILADDLGYGDTSIYGLESRSKTPNIERMAAEGVLLTDFHSNGALSSPTRAALMTGRYQQRTGIIAVVKANGERDGGLPLKEVTIAEALKKEGYETAIFGKWHLGYDVKFNPVNQGFDYFEGYTAGNIDYHSHLDASDKYDWWRGAERVRKSGYTTDLITDLAVDYIEGKKGKKPYFLYIPHEAVHLPLQGRNSPVKRKEEGVAYTQPKKESKSKEEVHSEMLEVLDEGVGKILDAVANSDGADNTIIIFTSDNGAMSMGSSAPLRGRKGHFFEGGHRVPTIIYSKGVKIAPEIPYTYNSPTMTMDLFPSFVKLAGGKLPDNLDGVDIFTSILRGEPMAERDLYWACDKERGAMRRGDWKIVYDDKDRYIFNLANDLSENNDLSAEKASLKEELFKAHAEWLKSITETN